MTTIKIKRAYDDPSPDDGMRILVDRLWPRGVKKEDLHADWDKDLAPSTELREWYHADEEGRWKEFEKKYAAELKASPAAQAFVDKVRGEKTVTLIYSAHNTAENNAVVLQEYLEKALR